MVPIPLAISGFYIIFILATTFLFCLSLKGRNGIAFTQIKLIFQQ